MSFQRFKAAFSFHKTILEYGKKWPIINRVLDKEKFSNSFLGRLLTDYKIAGSEIIEDGRQKPRKTIIVLTGLASLFAAMKTNPDEYSFQDQLVLHTDELAMLSDAIKNPESDNYIRYLTTCHNQGLLRRLNLIFFSVMWVDDYHSDCNLYAAECSYLKPRYITWYDRVIDVGVYGHWWNVNRKMKDMDINPDEWK